MTRPKLAMPQRDDLLILVADGPEGLEVVGTEIELERHAPLAAGRHVGTHLGGAAHQVAVRIVLRRELDAQLARDELARGAQDGGEELLLESEPAEPVVDAAGAVAAAADLAGLLLAVEIVVNLGIGGFVLVALLHARHRDVEVDVEHVDVARDHALRPHEGEEVGHLVAVLVEGVALLDIAARGKREAHHDGTVGLLGDLEDEVLGADRLAGIDAERILRGAGLEEIQVRAVVVLIILDLHRVGLRALRGELDLELAVFEGHDLRGGVGRGLQGRILVDRERGGRLDGGRAVRQRSAELRLGGLARQRLDAGDGIQLRLQLSLLAHLAGLEQGEADENSG